MSDEDFNIIRNPETPFTALIPGGMMPGRSITIRGTVLNNEKKKFHVDLCCGLLISGDHMDNKALHFNPRFEKPGGWFGGSGDEQIVVNTLINNQWGTEERFFNMFKPDEQFTIRILALEEYFKIAVNGKHLCDYEYRIKLDQIKAIHFDGCVRVDYIQFQPAILDGVSHQVTTPTAPQVLKSLDKPSVPFQLPLQGFQPPQTFHITLTPFLSGERFTINFHKNDEWVFHFRVDLPTNDNRQKGAVVRNSTNNGGKWGTEERNVSEFPFHKGVTCDLRFTAFQRSIAVDVNGQPYVQFSFRHQYQPSDINLLTVKGDVVIHRLVHKG